MVYSNDGYKLGINLATGYGLFTEVGEISRVSYYRFFLAYNIASIRV